MLFRSGMVNVVGETTVTTCWGVTVRSGTETADEVQKIVSPVLSPCGQSVVTSVGFASELLTMASEPPG